MKVDIIWNITRLCPWDCPCCCVDAIHVSRKGSRIEIRSNALSDTGYIQVTGPGQSSFDLAREEFQERNLELSLQAKLQILENLRGFKPKIDFSGGDPLTNSETIHVIREAALRFGKESVTLTSTGIGMALYGPEELSEIVGELNFSYDSPAQKTNRARPENYNSVNLRHASRYARQGIPVRAECPLTVYNTSKEVIKQIFLDLHNAEVNTFLLMRLFPVGRGFTQIADIPNRDQYLRNL
jgi:MoaA/NifB/PqqE/SkfB family radical SAM enzyme